MITVNPDGIDEVLRPLYKKAGNKKELMRTIAGILNFAIEENFKTEGKRLFSGGWKQLAKRTITERKKKKLWPGKILDRHGSSGLAGSITQKWGTNFAQVGTNKKYAAILNFGGEVNHASRTEIFERIRYSKGNKKGKFKKLHDDRAVKKGLTFKAFKTKIPARPFLKINKEDLAKVNSAVRNFLLQ